MLGVLGAGAVLASGWSDTVHDGFWAAVVLVSLGPFLLYAVIMRAPVPAMVTGVALVAEVSVVYLLIFSSKSSTAAIGYVIAAVLGYPIVVVGIAADAVVRFRPQIVCFDGDDVRRLNES